MTVFHLPEKDMGEPARLSVVPPNSHLAVVDREGLCHPENWIRQATVLGVPVGLVQRAS